MTTAEVLPWNEAPTVVSVPGLPDVRIYPDGRVDPPDAGALEPDPDYPGRLLFVDARPGAAHLPPMPLHLGELEERFQRLMKALTGTPAAAE